MKNISLNKEDLKLNVDAEYIVIDALYVNNIKEKMTFLDIDNFLDDVKSKVFPYNPTPFTKFKADAPLFKISRIRNNDNNSLSTSPMFSTDTGLILFIKKELFINLINEFNYLDLVDSQIDIINFTYWDALTNKYNLSDVGLILSPGIDSGVDFEGSGTYVIV